jgi:hypothetical protein
MSTRAGEPLTGLPGCWTCITGMLMGCRVSGSLFITAQSWRGEEQASEDFLHREKVRRRDGTESSTIIWLLFILQ